MDITDYCYEMDLKNKKKKRDKILEGCEGN